MPIMKQNPAAYRKKKKQRGEFKKYIENECLLFRISAAKQKTCIFSSTEYNDLFLIMSNRSIWWNKDTVSYEVRGLVIIAILQSW